ncbi:hypothetical protein HZA26_01500, partial [Candidatus Nomurabacteria bacterium]|nr:hypothetical protein [Candidatus Nomurabacteria bacterium]
FFGILYFFINSPEEIQAPPAPVQFTPLIFTEKSSFIEVDPTSEDPIYKSILKEFDSSDVKKDGILAVYLTENKKLVELSRFLKIIDADFAISDPEIFSESFLIGMLKNETEYPFLLLKIKSFADVFNDLRLWEEKIFYDLHDFFKIKVDVSNNYLLTKDFEDGVVQNKNARVLYSKDGVPVLMYVFIDDNSVVLSSSENVVKEIILRLDSAKIKNE